MDYDDWTNWTVGYFVGFFSFIFIEQKLKTFDWIYFTLQSTGLFFVSVIWERSVLQKHKKDTEKHRIRE